MLKNRRLGAALAIAGLAGIGIMALPGKAEAWWRGGFCCGVGIVVPPLVVAPPYYAPAPVYYPPPPTYYAPPTAYYAPQHGPWIPPHWQGGVWVPGHWG